MRIETYYRERIEVHDHTSLAIGGWYRSKLEAQVKDGEAGIVLMYAFPVEVEGGAIRTDWNYCPVVVIKMPPGASATDGGIDQPIGIDYVCTLAAEQLGLERLVADGKVIWESLSGGVAELGAEDLEAVRDTIGGAMRPLAEALGVELEAEYGDFDDKNGLAFKE